MNLPGLHKHRIFTVLLLAVMTSWIIAGNALCAGPEPIVENGVWTLDSFTPQTVSQWHESGSGNMKMIHVSDVSTGVQGGKIDVNFPPEAKIQRLSQDRTWPKDQQLDLTGWNQFEVDLTVSSNTPFSYSALYFHSGNGWYSSSSFVPQGRKTIVFNRSDFSIEGEPAGWDKVDRIRLSLWKSQDLPAEVIFHSLRCIQGPILFASIANSEGVEPWVGQNNARLIGNSLMPMAVSGDLIRFEQSDTPDNWIRKLKHRQAVIVVYDRFLKAEIRSCLTKWSSETGTPVMIIDRDLREQPLDESGLVAFLGQSAGLNAQITAHALTQLVSAAGVTIPADQASKITAEAKAVFQKDGLLAGVKFCRDSHNRILKSVGVKTLDSKTLKFRGWWNHDGLGAYKGDWSKTARELKAAGFTAVVPNLLWAGEALYPSELIPTGASVAQWGDQLDACVKACHAEGIEVHVWKVNFNLKYHRTSEYMDKMRKEGRLQKDSSGEEVPWLCPSNPANMVLETESMVEMVRKYPIDGIHFDYIRYDGGHCCYCDGCRQRFEKSSGKPVENWPADCIRKGIRADEYTQWRCDQITNIVRITYRKVKELRPDCKVSAAVFGVYPDCRNGVGQDWVAWAKEGIVDFLCPMNYTQQTESYIKQTRRQEELVPAGFPLYPGIGEWRLDADGTIEQIRAADQMGCPGFMIFNLTEKSATTICPLLTK